MTSMPWAKSVPTADTFTITVPAVGTSGAVTISPVVGGIDGFLANPAATEALKLLGIDLVLPSGLYNRSPSSGRLRALSVDYTVQARRSTIWACQSDRGSRSTAAR